MKFYLILLLITSSIHANVFSQPTSKSGAAASSARRADVMIEMLKIRDAATSSSVRDILAAHFDSLDHLFTQRQSEMKASMVSGNDELTKAREQAAWDKAGGKLNKMHAVFLGKLSATKLSTEEINKLKDAMTEGGLMREYNNYLALLPGMNDKQKHQVMMYLLEARENAMDAETAKMRVQWFIKYRGRANNYLAAAGHDLRKATEDLEKAALKNTSSK